MAISSPTRSANSLPDASRYKGIAAPFTRRPQGVFSAVGTRDVIWSSIANILLTPRGTRIMLPQFGSDLPNLYMEPNDELLAGQLRQAVVDAIIRWEPRVKLRDVQILVDPFNEHRLHVSISYVIVGETYVENRTLLLNLGDTLRVESV